MKQFTEPEIMIKQLEVEDVITTSGEEQESAIVYGLNQLGFN